MAMQHPIKQRNHRNVNQQLMPWLDLHFDVNSAYQGRVFLGHHKSWGTGIYNMSRRNLDELPQFVQEMHVSNRLDYYITPSQFSGVQRNSEGLFALQNIVIDIDCHGAEVETSVPELVEEFIGICARDLWLPGEWGNCGCLPMPNSVVKTGRGVQLWWAFDAVSIKLEWMVRRVQQYYVAQIQELLDDNPGRLAGLSIDRGASSNLAGWFRLPLTWNTQAQRWGELEILHDQRYTLQTLYDGVPEDFAVGPVRGLNMTSYVPLATEDKDVISGGTSSWALRIQKLIRLRAMRNAPIGAEKRDLFCLIVYSDLLADYDQPEAWSRLLAFNAGFRQPLSLRELEQKMKAAEHRRYKFSNKKIIEKLEITPAEQRAIGLHMQSSGKKKSNYTRDLIRATLKEDRDNKILALFAAGKSKAAIARELGIARNTVLKVIDSEIAAQKAVQEAQEQKLKKAVGSEAPQRGCAKMVPYMFVSYPEGGTPVDSNISLDTEAGGVDPPPD